MQLFKEAYTAFVKGETSVDVLADAIRGFVSRHPEQGNKAQIALSKLRQANRITEAEFLSLMSLTGSSHAVDIENPDRTVIRGNEDPTAHSAASNASGNTTSSTTGQTTSGRSQFTWTGFGQGESTTLEVGSVIKDRFLLDSVIGSGGMGFVFKARDLRKDEAQDRNPWVAIKILNEDFKNHPEALKALQRESRKSQELSHPNIITVFDFDRDGNNVYMTMELMEGTPLDKFIRAIPEKPIPVEEALRISHDMGQALAYAHRAGIVHSDFKPGNVFLVKNNAVKVFDFGIARASKQGATGAQGEVTQFDAGTLGALTPAYASLEMMRGEEPDARDDIYALACVTYELLMGKHPFAKKSADIAFENKLVVEPVPGLDRHQMRGLLKGLAFEREHRSESVEQFLEDMRKKTISKAAIRSGIAAALVLVIAGAVGTPIYLEKRKVDSIIGIIAQGDSVQTLAALETLNQLDKDTRNKVISDLETQDHLINFIKARINAIFNIDNKLYDYFGAKSLLARGMEYYKDSATLKELAENTEKTKDTLMLILDTLYSQFMQSGKLLDDGTADNIPAVLAIVAKVEPDSYLLKDKRLPNAYLSTARDHLAKNDIPTAEKITSAGIARFKGDTALINFQDLIAIEKTHQLQEARLAELTTGIETALTGLTLDSNFNTLEQAVHELRQLDTGYDLIKRVQTAVEALTTIELDKAKQGENWANYEYNIARSKPLVSVVWLAEKQGYLEQTQHGANWGLTDAINKSATEELAAGVLKLEGFLAKPDFTADWESSVRILLEDLDAIAAAYNQTAVLTDIHQKIAHVYAEHISAARSKERFIEADHLLARATKLSPDQPELIAEANSLNAAKEAFEQARLLQLKLARIESLKQSVLTQAKANDVDSARKSRDELASLAADDAFLTKEAPQAIVDAYTRLAKTAAKAKEFEKAMTLAQSALEISPNNASIKVDLQRYTTEVKKIDVIMAFKTPSKESMLTAEKSFTELRATLSPTDGAALQQEVIAGVAANIKALLATNAYLASIALPEAIRILGDHPSFHAIELPKDITPPPSVEPVTEPHAEETPTPPVEATEPGAALSDAEKEIQAATAGDVESQYKVGLRYFEGDDVKQDYKKAIYWFEKSEKQYSKDQDALAKTVAMQTALAGMYLEGKGTPKDMKKAFDWYLKAAKSGDLVAQRVTASFYLEGKDIPQDYTEAFKWFSKASSKGDTDSESGLGLMYFSGWGTAQDYVKAADLFIKAGKKGDVSSQSALGVMYLQGMGVEQDNKKAYTWITVAIANGFNDEQKLLDMAAASLQPDAIADAKAEAKKLTKSAKAKSRG